MSGVEQKSSLFSNKKRKEKKKERKKEKRKYFCEKGWETWDVKFTNIRIPLGPSHLALILIAPLKYCKFCMDFLWAFLN